MTDKIRKMLSMVLALTMISFVFAPSFAEDTEDFIEDEDEMFASFEDDEVGSAEEGTLLQNAPEMNEEIIFADDWSEALEAKSESEIERQEEVKRQAQEMAEQVEEPAVNEPVAEEPAAEEPEAEEPAAEEAAEEEPVTEEPAEEIFADATEIHETVAEEAQEEADEAEVADPESEEAEQEAAEETEAVEETEETEETEQTEKITVTVEAVMVSESEMKLTATVHGAEEREFAFQWQVSEDDGVNFNDIEDATEKEILVELTEEDFNNLWRVRVQTI